MQGAPAVGRQSAKKARSACGSRFHTYAWPLSGSWGHGEARHNFAAVIASGWRQMWRASADEDCDSEDGTAPGGAAPGGEGPSESPAAAAPPVEASADRAAAHGSAGPSGRAAGGGGGGGGGGAREQGGRAGAGAPGAVPHLMAAAGEEWPRPPPEGAAEVAAAELSARLAGNSYGAFDEDVRAMAAREVSGLGHARTRSQSQGDSPSASGASSPAASFHGGLDAGAGGGAALRRSGSMNLPLPEDSGVPATHPDMCIMRCRRNHLVQARARAGAPARRRWPRFGPLPARLPHLPHDSHGVRRTKSAAQQGGSHTAA